MRTPVLLSTGLAAIVAAVMGLAAPAQAADCPPGQVLEAPCAAPLPPCNATELPCDR